MTDEVLIFRASLFMFCGFDAYLGQMFTAHLNPSVIFFFKAALRNLYLSKLLKKEWKFKFDWSYLSYYHIFFIIIGIIKELV